LAFFSLDKICFILNFDAPIVSPFLRFAVSFTMAYPLSTSKRLISFSLDDFSKAQVTICR
jgi:hypothetical protein